ncbi:dihydroxyacetone phosphate acyltransferase-like [Antedon mediterranea]|uniref:dihydroxyacetone phosphate acyltransferase-like n=1 Tax=Antedon mediterranea TaxID=105859 RepID=UPI003AF5717D
MKETPVVLLPSHRSYNDFLLMSYILYHYNLPLPRIAAGADFMAMKFINNVLRWAGAFYIRRSFGLDKLYWAVFTEYVQRLIVNGEAPLEFFLEGTRSRTGKSLPPKLGLLSVVLEPFLKGKVSDISLIPIGVSYERILEETLYAREMLGIPKPKESTSGLIKARSIFEDDYGSIYINFGEPISIRRLCEGHVDRAAYSLAPRFLFSLTKSDQRFIFELAYTVLLEQQKTLVISPWVLIASLLLQSPGGIPLEYLCKRVEWLKDIFVNLGGNVKWPVTKSTLSVVKASLAVHHTAASVSKNNRVYINSASTWTAPGESHPTVAMTKEEVMTIATTHILLGSYRNQLTPMLKQAAMIALTFAKQPTLNKDIMMSRYRFLVNLMSKEFIFHPRTLVQDFDAILRKLEASYYLVISDDNISLTTQGTTLMQFLQKMFHPFVLGYWFACQYTLSLNPNEEISTTNNLARDIQDTVACRIAEGDLFEYDILSLNVLENAVKTCIQLGGLVNNNRNYSSAAHIAGEADNQWEASPGCQALRNLVREANRYLVQYGEDFTLKSLQ